MKTFITAVAVGVMLLCAACAQGDAPASGAGASGGSLTMYGTIDQGVTFKK